MADRPASAPEWTNEVADRIESVVGLVRDRTTAPATKAARLVVYGLLAGFSAMVAFVLLVIAVLRLHVYMPFGPEGRRVWVTDAGVGAIFVLAGALLWRKRVRKQP